MKNQGAMMNPFEDTANDSYFIETISNTLEKLLEVMTDIQRMIREETGRE